MTQPAQPAQPAQAVPIGHRWDATEEALELLAPATDAALVAAADVHTGAMIALVPSDADAQRITVEDGEAPGQLHVTLMYLGEAAAIPREAQDAIVARIRAMVEDAVRPDYNLPLEADGFAISVFNPGDAVDRDTCIVLGLSGADLDAVHGMTVDCVAEVRSAENSFEIPDQHLPWVPHLTLIYTDDVAMVEELTDRVGPIVFDRLRCAFAGELIDIPLTAPDTGAQTSTGDSMGDKASTATTATGPADGTATTFQTECPPGSHMMPDGSCMADEEMPGYEAAAADGEVPPPAPIPPGEHFHTIVTEGVSTGFRTFVDGGLDWREPPFAFHYEYSAAAHGGLMMTTQVGLVTRVERDGADIHMWGPLDLEDQWAVEFARKLVQGYCRWTSVGLDESAEVELVWPEPAEGDTEGEGDILDMLFGEPEQLMISGTICEATAVSTPALADATVEPTQELIDALQAKGIVVASVTEFAAVAVHHTPVSESDTWDGPANEARLDSPLSLATARAGYAWIDMDRVDGGEVPKDGCKFLHHDVTAAGQPGAANMEACSSGIGILNGGRGGTTIPDADRQGVYDHLAAHLRDGDREPPELMHVDSTDAAVLTAASYTVTINELPPAWWFEEPVDVSPDLAWTVTDQGRVFGFIAQRDIPHRSFRDRRVVVPIEKVDMSKWMKHDGAMTDAGWVKAGPITMGCGHANPHSTDYAGRVEHYDNSCSIVAHAAAGVSQDRIWVAGALLPGVTAEQIARMWAMRLSGDWQPHRDKAGWQEFIAALLVPVPGFAGSSDQLRPPRAQASVRMKGGMLVASAVPVRYQVTPPPVEEPDMRPALDMIARQVGLDPAARMTVLRRRLGK